MTKTGMRREDLKPGEVLCSYCSAKCCRYYALAIETPTTRDDFDHLRWYLMHGRAALFVEDETWYLMVYNDCKHLRTDNLCAAYEDRPKICQAYKTDNCEYDDDACYDKFFESPEQVWEYAEAVLPPARWRRGPKRQPDTPIKLPLLEEVTAS